MLTVLCTSFPNLFKQHTLYEKFIMCVEAKNVFKQNVFTVQIKVMLFMASANIRLL